MKACETCNLQAKLCDPCLSALCAGHTLFSGVLRDRLLHLYVVIAVHRWLNKDGFTFTFTFLSPPPSVGFGVSVLLEAMSGRSIVRSNPLSYLHRQIQTSVPRCPALGRTCTHYCIPQSFVASEVGIDVGEVDVVVPGWSGGPARDRTSWPTYCFTCPPTASGLNYLYCLTGLSGLHSSVVNSRFPLKIRAVLNSER